MAPTSAATLSLKLLVDTKSQRVLYAEAGEDAIDFLFSLLATPVGDSASTGGSIFNLYKSAAAKKLEHDVGTVGSSIVGRFAGRDAPPPAGAWLACGSAAVYTVTDDLKIEPMSTTVSAIARLSSLGVKDIAKLQEKTVQLGYTEGLEMLKASLKSKTVLTDVFVGKKESAWCGLPSKRGVAKLLCGILALSFVGGLLEHVTQGHGF